MAGAGTGQLQPAVQPQGGQAGGQASSQPNSMQYSKAVMPSGYGAPVSGGKGGIGGVLPQISNLGNSAMQGMVGGAIPDQNLLGGPSNPRGPAIDPRMVMQNATMPNNSGQQYQVGGAQQSAQYPVDMNYTKYSGQPQQQPQTQPAANQGSAPPNIFSTAAQGMNQGIKTAGMETMYRPQDVNVGMAGTTFAGYAPQVSADQVGYNPVASTNVSADRVASTNVAANNVNAGQIADANFSAYMNPYESQVVGQSLSDLDRARQMQAMQLNAQAQKAGAFGGSRQALMQSELGRNYLDQAARTASGLRQAGFQNAQQLAGQDIATRMQADLANQGANLQASQLNQSAAMQAALANQQAGLQAGTQNQQAAMQAALANQGAGIQTGLANQAANLQAGTLNANLGQQVNLANQAARNQMSQFNIGNQLQAALANQQAGLAGSQNRLAAAGQLGQLSNLGFGQGMELSNQAMQQGSLAQGINQMLIDAAKGQFAGYQGAPAQSLGFMAQALGATPTPTTTTQSRNPGLFDYLTLGASMFPRT